MLKVEGFQFESPTKAHFGIDWMVDVETQHKGIRIWIGEEGRMGEIVFTELSDIRELEEFSRMLRKYLRMLKKCKEAKKDEGE